MAEQVHRVLDGELDADELSADELAERTRFEEAVQAALDEVPREPAPDLTPTVMRRIELLEAAAQMGHPRARRARQPTERRARLAAALGPLRRSRGPAGAPSAGPLRGALAWFWRPRRVPLRPAYALLAAAVVAALLLLPSTPPEEATAPAPAVAARVFVQFRLDSPGATTVQLAGDFTDWKPSITLHEVAPGVWSAEVPLDPGLYDYAFVVDGKRWVADPVAPQVEDGFGGSNSRVAVLPPQTAESL